MFTTPQDYFKTVTDIFAAFPKNPKEFTAVLEKTKKVYETEAENVKVVISTYSKASKGDATLNEMTTANKKAQELLVTTRFATIMALPGAIFTLPVLNKIAEDYNLDLIPESVKKAFEL